MSYRVDKGKLLKTILPSLPRTVVNTMLRTRRNVAMHNDGGLDSV